MSDSAGDFGATRANLGRNHEQCDRDKAGNGPKRLQPLTGGDEADAPTDENWRPEIKRPAGLKIEIREFIYLGDKRRIGSRQKYLPAGPQNKKRNRPSARQKKQRGQTERRPRRPHAPGLELPLLSHRPGELLHPTEPDERRGFRIGWTAARALLLRSQIGQMIGELCQIAPYMPWRDAGLQQALAKCQSKLPAKLI